MKFCMSCGAQMQDEAGICPACGNQMGTASAQGTQTPPPGQRYEQPVMPGAPGQADIRDVQENKMMAVLAYIIFFIPLLTGAHRTSPFVRYHANQGTVLFIAAAIYGIAYSILAFILAFIPVIGWLLILVLGFAGIIFPILVIVGIINVVNGKMSPLPVIGGMTIVK